MTQTDTMAQPAQAPAAASDELIAEPDVGYRWKHLIMAVLMIAAGLWFAYDGWFNWPRQNEMADKIAAQLETAQNARRKDAAKIEQLASELKKYEKHNDVSIMLQKILAFALPTFGIFWGGWTLRETRGRFRLAGTTLHAPKHPPITFENVRRIDKRRWDRKGVAFLHYEHGSPPQPGIIKLDDFAYERKAIDGILQRIEENVLPAASPSAPAART